MNQKQNLFLYRNFSQYFSFYTSNIIRCLGFTKDFDFFFFTTYFRELKVLKDLLVSHVFLDVRLRMLEKTITFYLDKKVFSGIKMYALFFSIIITVINEIFKKYF